MQELALISSTDPDEYKENDTTNFFYYDSIKLSLISKIRQIKNGKVILKSQENDLEISLKIGDPTIGVSMEYSIKNKKLCSKNI